MKRAKGVKRTKAISKMAAPGGNAHIISADDWAATGKALRNSGPREQHGKWKEFKGRPNPIDLLHKSDAGRLKELVPIRYGRMLESPFAFYRGSAGLMASDLSRTPSTGLTVQACGDCHLMNFGGFATPERNVIFDINDFDETERAPWEWDVKRLVASVVLAARSIGLSDGKGRDCAVAGARSYREHMREYSRMDPLQVWYSTISAEDIIEMVPKAWQKGVKKRIEKAAEGSGSELDFPKLAGAVGGQIRITDQPPLIFHPEETRASDAEARHDQIFRAYRETLPENRRMLLDRYRLVDVAIKVVGVGSVGRRCWIALMMSESNSPLFLQFKETVQSVLEPYAGKSAYQPRGPAILCAAAAGRQDQAVARETFDAEILELYAMACGWVLARAHSKVSEISATISGYLGSSSDEFDEAMGKFGLAYADQAEHDYAALKAAVRKGKITVYQGS